MPRVLIPSDNRDFVFCLAEAYRAAGWDVVVGTGNFDLAAGEFDLVHLQWPEELGFWREPSDARLAEIRARLDDWRRKARVALTVHNLRPHRTGDSAAYRRLYDAVYERVHVVAHFTNTSREEVAKEFPSSAQAEHVVTGYFNFDRLLPRERDPAGARQKLDLAPDAFVVLVFGGLREWAEVELIKAGFEGASIPAKRLLMCGRYDEPGSGWRQRWRRWCWSRWLQSRHAVVFPGFIPDAEVGRVVDAADAVVVPRFRALNSGLPALGASFGKIIVAPRCGSYPEILAGTGHPIYEPGDGASLARALEEAARLNRSEIASECRRLVDAWQWSAMVRVIVTALRPVA